MTLYELTRKLVARGMPEHPRLVHQRGVWYIAVHTLCDYEILDDWADARDLIAMHAMRWFTGPNFGQSEYGEIWGGYFGRCEYVSCALDSRPNPRAQWYVSGMWPSTDINEGCTFYHGYGADILEAIEAATRHLEAK